jgi:hypothetical protein
MKKNIRLTEDDLINIVKRVLNEQFNKEFSTQDSNESGDDELNSKMESYKNKMDNFLDKLKSSGDKIDGARFLKQVRNQTDQLFFELFEKSNSTHSPLTSFAQLQLELIRHFRHKLKEQ